MIKTGKVIHVRMGDEHLREAHELARRQHGNVAEVEKQRPVFITKVDIQSGIPERIVDQPSFEKGTHGPPWSSIAETCSTRGGARHCKEFAKGTTKSARWLDPEWR